MLDARDILKHLPHRFPFLLVDRVISIDKGHKIVGLKNVSFNEPFFQGHFPGVPIMPGVLIVEALAQCAGILGLRSNDREDHGTSIFYFAGANKVKFKRPVVPGDQLRLEAIFTADKRGIWKFDCAAYVENELACSAEIVTAERGTI